MTSSKVVLGFNRIRRTRDLDDLSQLLFPTSRNQRKAFLAIFIELKWADRQFVPSLNLIAEQHGITKRVLETTRAKMRKLGLIDHISRFSKQHGYREGWTLSSRFGKSLRRLADTIEAQQDDSNGRGESKDRHLLALH